jgi:hypothetical protein
MVTNLTISLQLAFFFFLSVPPYVFLSSLLPFYLHFFQLISMYHPAIRRDTEEIHENFAQDIWLSGKDLNQVPPEQRCKGVAATPACI